MSPALQVGRARELVGGMPGRRLLVVGDLMVDRFLWGSVHRISPEAPVPVVQLASESSALGGAGNVARNLRALGAEVNLVAVVGKDPMAEECRRLVEEAGISSHGLFEIEGRRTTVKTRVIAHHQQVVRIDRESGDPIGPQVSERLAQRVRDLMRGTSAVILSDYDKGLLTPFLLSGILAGAREAGLKVYIDPKPANYDSYRGCTALTPNLNEAQAMSLVRGRAEADIQRMGESLLSHLGCEAVLLTRGEEGMTLFQKASSPIRIHSGAKEVYDVTGAGDSVISVLSLAMTSGASFLEASLLANAAAGVVVGKLGTAVVTAEELLQAFEMAGEKHATSDIIT